MTQTKFSLAKESFKTVLDADVHFDNKASRSLSAMAFLTAAAVAIYREVTLVNNLSAATLVGLNWAVIALAAYLFCILTSAILYAAALGPSLNIPFTSSNSGGTTTDDVNGNPASELKSLLFFTRIADMNKEEWETSWARNAGELEKDMESHLIYETYLIAERTKSKHFWMSLGSIWFKLSLLALFCVASNIFKQVHIIKLSAVIFVMLFIAFNIWEIGIRPSRNIGGWLERTWRKYKRSWREFVSLVLIPCIAIFVILQLR